MSRPRPGALIDALRLIVLDGDVSTLPKGFVAALLRRKWVRLMRCRPVLTRLGHRILKDDGDNALREIFAWLKSDEGKRYLSQ